MKVLFATSRLARYALLVLVVACLYGAWREYAFRRAVREIKSAGFVWDYDDPIEILRQNWKAAFEWKTWTNESRSISVEALSWSIIADHRESIERLRPRRLIISRCTGPGRTDALRNLRSLEELSVAFCEEVQSVDGIENLANLKVLTLGGNIALENVTAIKRLSGLKALSLELCPHLTRESIAELEAALPKATILHDFGRSFSPVERL